MGKIIRKHRIKPFSIEYHVETMLPIKAVFEDKYEIEFDEETILQILRAYLDSKMRILDAKPKR